jgi:hypothetical protein
MTAQRERRLTAGDTWPAYAAAALALASAAVSLFWTLGGTLLLDTVGGAIEDLARERTVGAIALGLAAAAVKVVAGVHALALARPWGEPLGRRRVLGASATAAAILILWGGANVLVGGLVLADVITPSTPPDERSLRWHVFLWDLWFLVWGVALAMACARARQRSTLG